MSVPEITDKYIVIRMADPDLFVPGSFKTLWVDKKAGIQEVMAQRVDSTSVEPQSYVFDKNEWTIEDAKAWVRSVTKEQKGTIAGLQQGKRRTFVNASMVLLAAKPNLSVGTELKKLTRELYNKGLAEAGSTLNDKYFFYVEGIHSGKNKNGDVFTQDELVANYKSAGYQLIDWEHMRDQVIGFSLESELKTGEPESVAVAFTGILNRLSPYLQIEERDGDIVVSRDELVRQRFFEDKLAVSMECLFDSVKCQECGFETNDALDFDFHKMLHHRDILDRGDTVGRILVGVDFCGWGIVKHPADIEAYTSNLRTSEDGTIEALVVEASLIEKYGDLAENVAFANQVATLTPTDTLVDVKKMVFASEMSKKTVNNSPKTNNNSDTNLDKNPNDSTILGGNQMFKLSEKISAGMSLSEALVIAQKTLRDFQGDKALDTAATEAFASELAEAIKSIVTPENFRVADINTVTDAQKLEAIESVRKEEQALASTALNELQNKYDALVSEKEVLEAQVAEKDTEIAQLKEVEANKVIAAKVDNFMKELEEAGVKFADEDFKADVRTLVEAKIDNENSLKEFRGSLVASIKQSILTTASNNSGASAGNGGSNEPSGMTAKLDKAAQETNK